MSIFLETKHLIIKTPVSSDFENLYRLQADVEVMRYIGQGTREREEVEEGLQKAIMHYEKYGFSLGCMFEKETGAFVGRAGLIHLAFDDTKPDIEVCYAALREYWHKGYATEVTDALIQWGFAHLPLRKLVAATKFANKGAHRVLEKVGMQYVRQDTYQGLEVLIYEIVKAG